MFEHFLHSPKYDASRSAVCHVPKFSSPCVVAYGCFQKHRGIPTNFSSSIIVLLRRWLIHTEAAVRAARRRREHRCAVCCHTTCMCHHVFLSCEHFPRQKTVCRFRTTLRPSVESPSLDDLYLLTSSAFVATLCLRTTSQPSCTKVLVCLGWGRFRVRVRAGGI